MDARKLEHFVAVAESGSFTRAAAESRISQSGLSASIRALENELGFLLFERTTRHVLLTSAGAALLPHARRIRLEIAAARATAAAVRSADSGSLALGAVQTFTAVDLPAAIAGFHAAHPAVEVTLREAPTLDLMADVMAGRLDLAFVALDATPVPAGLSTLVDYAETLSLIVGDDHSLAGRDEVRLDELARVRFVDFQAGLGLQTFVESLFDNAGVGRNITLRTSEMDQALALVRHGLGAAVVPAPIARRSGLPCIALAPGPPARSLALIGRAALPLTNPAARAFTAMLGLPA
ncbi:LysR family transcriptional regulator [Tomitella gaofuii]|uniref:LysR family transcriptional regulator n=1 Tax=Tomitella gaofuii TaxID=2760083 RepID=UPI0015F83FD5|nr:LysR family transcriptional regulator [Tomitella gaofuii]